MEDITLNVLDTWNIRNIRFNVKSSADGNVRAVESILLCLARVIPVHIAHSMGPFGTILERGYANHRTVELDIRSQLESLNI
jgi:hypothetical protein